jgi:hypothetical protein
MKLGELLSAVEFEGPAIIKAFDRNGEVSATYRTGDISSRYTLPNEIMEREVRYVFPGTWEPEFESDICGNYPCLRIDIPDGKED